MKCFHCGKGKANRVFPLGLPVYNRYNLDINLFLLVVMGEKMSLMWSEEENAALNNLAAAGYTARQIHESGVLKSRSLTAILKYAEKNNIKLAGMKPEIDMDKLKEMLDGAIRNQSHKVRKA